MSSEKNTRTETYKLTGTLNYNTNGLGEIIQVDYMTLTDDSYSEDFTEMFYESWFNLEVSDYNNCIKGTANHSADGKIIAVLFKPYNGVLIHNINSHYTTTQTVTKSTDTGGSETDEWEGTKPSVDFGKFGKTHLVYDRSAYSEPEYYFLGTYSTSINSKCESIAKSTYRTQGSVIIEEDKNPELDSVSEETEETLTWNITVEGETNYLDLKVFGDLSDCTKELYYAKDGYGQRAVYLKRQTSVSKTYSNIVFMDGKYELNGDSLPDNIGTMTYSDTVTWQIPQLSYKSWALPTNNLDHSFWETSDPHIRTILLYCDCFFAIYQALQHNDVAYCTQKGLGEDSIPYESISDRSKTFYCSGFKIPDNNVSLDYKNETLYANYNQYKKLKNTIEELMDYTRNPEVSIPTEHRWIQRVGNPGGNTDNLISGYYNIVKLIKKGEHKPIAYDITAVTPFARYTKYWVIKDNKNGITVVSKNDYIPTTDLNNIQCFPIIKPYALVSMIVHSKYSSNNTVPGPLTGSISGDQPYQQLKNCINDYYRFKYLKLYEFTTDTPMNKNNFLELYAKTLSPFKIENWHVHGGRHAFDQTEYDNNVKNVGRNRYFIQNTSDRGKKFIVDSDMYKLHEACVTHSRSIPGVKKLKLIFNSACCFGQGIQNCVTTRDRYNICNSASNLAPSDCDMFWNIGACSTHCGMGTFENGKCVPDYIMDTLSISDTISYVELKDTFNTRTDLIQKAVYKHVEKFFNHHYDRMALIVRPEIKPHWTNSAVKSQIQSAIQNQGKWLFYVQSEKSDHPYYSNSEFQIEYWDSNEGVEKKYNINESFIENIKLYMTTYFGVEDPSRIFDDKWRSTIDEGIDSIQDKLDTKLTQLTNFLNSNYELKERYTTMCNEIDSSITNYAPWDKPISSMYQQILDSGLFDNNEDIKEVLSEVRTWQYILEQQNDGNKLFNSIFNEVYYDVCNRITDDGSDSYKYILYSSISNPIIGCSGEFLNGAIYLTNPNVEEDNWLASDNDLKKLRELTFVAKKTIKA